MSEESLPHKIDAFRFAENGLEVQGTVPLQSMGRLTGSLADTLGAIFVMLRFSIDEQGIAMLRGAFKGALHLQCQRCMGLFDYQTEGNFVFAMVRSDEEMDNLPKGYDPIVLKDGMLVAQDIIEDELIVSLPIVAKHRKEECSIKLPLEIGEPLKSTEANPFQVIELLRNKRNTND